ncbi:MAG: hypothetical protein K2V38_18745, partial [Gemmataceae bacterium]|nr:hypothetical protein [Gemmataceae bacterium]
GGQGLQRSCTGGKPVMNWPEDHPGRFCGRCGHRVYPIWIDDTPPPGTCPENASCAKLCLRTRSDLALGLFVAKETRGGCQHPQSVRRMERAGLTREDLEAELAFQARRQAASYELSYGELLGERLAAWLAADPEPRALALIERALAAVDWCDGQRTLLQIDDLRELFAARVQALLSELSFRDYEPSP